MLQVAHVLSGKRAWPEGHEVHVAAEPEQVAQLALQMPQRLTPEEV